MTGRIALTILVSMFLVGCGTEHYEATATCGGQTFTSDIGRLNTGLLGLGDTGILYVAGNQVTWKRLAQLPQQSVVVGDTGDSYTTSFNSSLNVTFTGNTPDQSVAAQLNGVIQKSTTLEVDKFQRVSFNDAIGLLNNAPSIKQPVMQAVSSNPNTRAFLVSSVVNAQKLQMGLNNGTSVGADVTAVKIGKRDLTVSYQCNNVLGMTGSSLPVFITAEPLAFDKSGNAYLDTSSGRSSPPR